MANPQLENGYTRIANELLEEIGKRKFTATQYKILLCIIRNTYGFGRKVHPLSATYMAKWANISVPGVKRDVQKLFRDNIIYCDNPNSRGVTLRLGINKNYDSWNMSYTGIKNETGIVCDASVASKTIPAEVSEMIPNKRNIKEKSKENIYSDFFEKLWELYPRKRGKSSVSAKAKKELYAAGYDKVMSAIEAYKKEVAGREERYILQGSTFFNGRWKDFAAEVPCKDLKSESTDTVFDRFNGLDSDVFQQYRELGIIDDEGNIDLFLADEEQKKILQKVGAL